MWIGQTAVRPGLNRTATGFAIALLALLMGFSSLRAQDDPTTAPIPDLSVDPAFDGGSLLVEVLFNGPTTLELVGVDWAPSSAHTQVGNPLQYRVVLRDQSDQILRIFGVWNPLWSFVINDDGSESLRVEESSIATIVIPVTSNLSRMEIVEEDSSDALISIDLEPTVLAFCIANPDHPECEGVEPGNSAPVAKDDQVQSLEEQSVTFNVADNDTDIDENLDPESVTALTLPTRGSLSGNGMGSFTYDPEVNFAGSDSFTYEVCDTGADGDPITDEDDLCATATVDITVQPINDPPMLDELSDFNGSEGTVVTVTATFSDADDTSGHTATVDFGDGTGAIAATLSGGDISASHVYADEGSYGIVVAVVDPAGASNSVSANALIVNQVPTVVAGANQTVLVGELVSLAPATFNDPGTADTHTATVNWGDGTQESGSVSETPSGPPGSVAGTDGTVAASHRYSNVGSFVVQVTVVDDDGGQSVDGLTVSVEPDGSGDKLGPVVSSLSASPNPAFVNEPVLLIALVDDQSTGGSDIFSAEYSLDGGHTWRPAVAEDGAFDSVSEMVRTDLGPFVEPGLIELCLRGRDTAGNIGDDVCTQLVIVDPNGDFVTGGGWIQPMAPNKGRGVFNFTARYRPNSRQPIGEMQFHFSLDDLKFKATGYDWLVIAPNRTIAQFQGTGKIAGSLAPNGTPYRFFLSANDGDTDSIRIRIWWVSSQGTDSVIFENGLGQDLAGGSIIIHRSKSRN